MLITLMLSASLYAPAAPPESPLPRFVELKPDEDGKVRIDVMRPRKDAEAKAQIIALMPRTESRPNPRAMSNHEFVITQMEVMRSFEIIQYAAKRIESAKIESLPKGDELIAHIRRNLRVNVHRDAETESLSNVISLSFKSPHREDCQKVLSACIQSYLDVVSGIRFGETDLTLKQIVMGRQKAEEDLHQSHKEYEAVRERIRNTSPLWVADLKAKIAADTNTLTSLYHERNDLQAAKVFADQAVADGKDKGAILVVLKVINSLPQYDEKSKDQAQKAIDDLFDLYLKSTKSKLKDNQSKSDGISLGRESDRQAAAKLEELQLQEKMVFDKMERMRKRLEAFTERKQAFDLERDTVQVYARLINPPTVTSAKGDPVLERSELADVKDLKISKSDGSEVSKEDALKSLAKGGVVLISLDGKPAPASFLKTLKSDVLVLVSPEFVGLGWKK